MDAESPFDPFNLCLNVIIKEAEKHKAAFFKEKHCKRTDSRDTNFNVVENRVGYVYKYGCYNILFFQKCFSEFLNGCANFENLFPFENLKACSLSNAPGLDIIGLFCALRKSNKSLKCFPVLKAINLYRSWAYFYKTIIKSFVSELNVEYFHIPSDNVHLIQGDIFSTLSAEARNCIMDSNVLLMVKVYFSTKATSDVLSSSLKEIFSLLKPGSLIFFIGNKNNTKQFSKFAFVSQFVKCIYGPQKVTLDNVSFNESIVNKIGIKPCDSGFAEFLVWQRNDEPYLEAVKEKKKRKKKSKQTLNKKEQLNDCDNDVASVCKYDTDVESNVSCNSDSKQSSILDEVKSDSNSNLFSVNSQNEVKSENKLNLVQNDVIQSLDNITSVLDKVRLTDSDSEEKSQGIVQNNNFHLDNNNSSNLANNIKFENETKSHEQTNEKKNINPKVVKQSDQEKKKIISRRTGTSSKINTIPPIAQNIVHTNKVIDKATSGKVKSKAKPSEKKSIGSHIKIEQDKQDPKLVSQQNFPSTKKPSEKNVPDLKDRNESNLNSLVQRCESLVTTLEKLTAEIKNIGFSENNQCFPTNCRQPVCQNATVSHCCCCSVNVMFSCCKKLCNCKITHDTCMLHSNSCKEGHDNNKSRNFSKPYLTIPLQNEDVLKILTSNKS